MSAITQQWAVVTGASSGIGRSFAELFAAKGINVLLVARNKAELTKVADNLQKKGVQTVIVAGDLAKQETMQLVLKTAESKELSVRYLINSAGFGDYGPFVAGEWQKQQAMIDLNITSVTYLTKCFAERMQNGGGGKIVNLASIAAFFPGPLLAEYYATKAYVLNFSVALANELTGSGVTVTALCPGPTKTNFAAAAAATRSGIFSSKDLPTSMEVAEFGYKAMERGKAVAVHGIKNKLAIASTRLFTPSMAARLVRLVQT